MIHKSIKKSFFIFFILPNLMAQDVTHWDSSRYIRFNEIRPDMPAYCLSVLEGDKIDRYDLKIISIVKNTSPQRNRILVVGLDERFKRLGSIHGCSGSPVYIDGKMAGALSAGWDGSIDPLYLVTPIEEMLEIGATTAGSGVSETQTKPINVVQMSSLVDFDKIYTVARQAISTHGPTSTLLPLATSFSAKTCQMLTENLELAGLTPLQADGEIPQTNGTKTFVPGGVLSVPLCSGDARMAVVGTVTEVVGDRVYGFGHPFLGTGQINLPMAAGIVHTVVATRMTSFKLASAGDILGTLKYDQSPGVAGVIGPKPKMIDLQVKLRRFDQSEEKVFNCNIVIDRRLTPVILQAAIMGTGSFFGDLPPEHAVWYRCEMTLENQNVFRFENLTSQQELAPPAMLSMSLAAAMMNNPFEQIAPEKVSVELDIRPENLTAGMWEVKLAESVLRPGQTAQAVVTVKGFRSQLKQFQISLPIPEDCPDGKYQLILCGADTYLGFLTKTMPQKFIAVDSKSLIGAMQRILAISNDGLYACLATEPSGVSIRNQELPDLPASKMMTIADNSRIVPVTPFQHVIQNSIQTGLVISGQAAVELTIDKDK